MPRKGEAMRMTPEEVRERFEDRFPITGLPAPRADALAFALKLAADLQTPPTGDEVEQALTKCHKCVHDLDSNRTAWIDDIDDTMASIRAYGSACHDAGRAEAGKAADVLKRLENALSQQLPRTRAIEVRPHRDGSWVVQAAPWLDDSVKGRPTLLDAISAALDQLKDAHE